MRYEPVRCSVSASTRTISIAFVSWHEASSTRPCASANNASHTTRPSKSFGSRVNTSTERPFRWTVFRVAGGIASPSGSRPSITS